MHVNHQQYPARLSDDEVFIFFEREAPARYHQKHVVFPKNYFNITVNYLPYADVPMPYGTYSKIGTSKTMEEFKADLLESVKSRTKGVYKVFSHCKTQSRRENLISEMQRYMPIDLYGKCGNMTCDKECFKENKEKYRFYLAFENSLCDYYSTEKFYQFNSLVPIVMSRKFYKHLPQDSFIAVDDFRSLSHLAKYIQHLMTNDTAYIQHLLWKYESERSFSPFYLAMCKVCSYVAENKGRKVLHYDVEEYSIPSRTCVNLTNYR
ncbi:unnamed protein product [Bursaphelenchus xylophilus]|uniref:Fucosyltransferase n=1 Tax=Bursaphelenchus xylophilus TaxID=6326 RepID=A0A1I7RQC2_BURXY|nr:unnamed protein product [Bursaphelenchus xylophilus]CAG9104340.1 unnamed protein product [Bursaphelenchus xylophilus]